MCIRDRCSGQHVALVLDRAGTQQQFPVRLARGVGEGRRHTQHITRRIHQRAVQLRKAQVVADAQPQTQWPRLHRHRGKTGLQRAAFVVRLAAVVVGKEVQLVVMPRLAAIGCKHATAVEHPSRRTAVHRQRAAHQPQPVPARRVGQELLDGPAAGWFRCV